MRASTVFSLLLGAVFITAGNAGAGVATFTGDSDATILNGWGAPFAYDADSFILQNDDAIAFDWLSGWGDPHLKNFGTVTIEFQDVSNWWSASDTLWWHRCNFEWQIWDSGGPSSGTKLGELRVGVNPHNPDTDDSGMYAALYDEPWATLQEWGDWSLTTPHPPTKWRLVVDDTNITVSFWDGGAWVAWPTVISLADVAAQMGAPLDELTTGQCVVRLQANPGKSLDIDQIVIEGPEITSYNVTDTDTDGDGLLDSVETNTGTYVNANDTGTDPSVADTDGDGLNDGEEVNDYHTNPVVADTDGDGVNDGDEVAAGTDPLVADVQVPVAGAVGLALLAAGALLAGVGRLAYRKQ